MSNQTFVNGGSQSKRQANGDLTNEDLSNVDDRTTLIAPRETLSGTRGGEISPKTVSDLNSSRVQTGYNAAQIKIMKKSG